MSNLVTLYTVYSVTVCQILCSLLCLEMFAMCFALQEGKRKFDKETTKFSQSLDRYLNMKQNKSNETQLLEVSSFVSY